MIDRYGDKMFNAVVRVGEQRTPQKHTYADWKCPLCKYSNIEKVKLEEIDYIFECTNCGAEYEVNVYTVHD